MNRSYKKWQHSSTCRTKHWRTSRSSSRGKTSSLKTSAPKATHWRSWPRWTRRLRRSCTSCWGCSSCWGSSCVRLRWWSWSWACAAALWPWLSCCDGRGCCMTVAALLWWKRLLYACAGEPHEKVFVFTARGMYRIETCLPELDGLADEIAGMFEQLSGHNSKKQMLSSFARYASAAHSENHFRFVFGKQMHHYACSNEKIYEWYYVSHYKAPYISMKLAGKTWYTKMFKTKVLHQNRFHQHMLE